MHRVLYIDDDEVLARLVARRLKRAGYDVVHAAEPEAALALIGAAPVDVIVLDHYLREGTGHDVLRRLAALGNDAPVVYVTASSEASVAVEALKSGAADYVIKTASEDFLALLERSIRQSLAAAEARAERARSEAEIRRARDRAEALLVEVNHRVANSLALVTSLLRLQLSATPDEGLKGILNETCGRIAAIANVHRSLYTEEEVHHVRMDRYLQSLTADLELTLPGTIRLSLAVEPVWATSDRAVAVGIIFTELVTNAARYAYPAGTGGEVRVGLARIAEGRARLVVADDGVGIDPDAPAKGTGLGRRVIGSMAMSLGSSLDITSTSGGTRAEVEFGIGRDGAPSGVASVA